MTDERAAVVADAIRRNVRRHCPRYGNKVVEEVVAASVAGTMRGPNASMVRGSFNNLLDDVLALRAENERLKAENASLKEANEIDLGEKAPLIFENTELSARVSELTRLLGEAESAIRWFHGYDEPNTPDFPPSEPGRRYGFRSVSREIQAVQRALQSGEGKEPSR